ncbi:hypothetical protein RIF29_11364 [Crotalaria pallida]|uniref:Uncharacterized protein n=1 Tax=Crotalaria pallida TaxID=3830 RepID=A0AAN9IM30_CROPI
MFDVVPSVISLWLLGVATNVVLFSAKRSRKSVQRKLTIRIIQYHTLFFSLTLSLSLSVNKYSSPSSFSSVNYKVHFDLIISMNTF